METMTLNIQFDNFSQKIAELFGIFSPNNYTITKFLLKKLGSKSQELYKLTQQLIEEVDSEPFENVCSLNGINVILPLIDMVKNLKFNPSTKEELELIDEFQDSIILFKRAITLVSDFIEALDQYFDDNGKNKLTYYIYLIDEYRQSRDENIEINNEFGNIDLTEWL